MTGVQTCALPICTELDWMRRMPQARGHKARYREDAFYELEKVAKQRFNNDNVKLEVKASYIGSKIFEADHLFKSYGDLKILDDFSYIFARYEKMGIVGNNGTGKSTFIKILMGQVGKYKTYAGGLWRYKKRTVIGGF